MQSSGHYDVIILGAGLAGLTLSRHLLRASDKHILVLDKSSEIPTPRQKYGESTVQVGGYYFSKVLDLEEYLLHEHFMKYNLRFYFKTPGRENTSFEDYSQAYIRNFSNIPSFLFDRNRFEADVLQLNQADPRFTLEAPAQDIRVKINEDDRHVITYRRDGQNHTANADWVVDATGRGRALARQMEIREPAPIDHGSAFMWVEGTVDIEKLTDSTPDEIRLSKNRRATGHIPHWLATNHFLGEGFWFWLIPLRGMTSLGLVYDNQVIDGRKLCSAERLRDWICEEFPLFARDLTRRRILDFNILKSYAHNCGQTISKSRWAMTGESGRFADPLYSPGSDFIALHNTLIVDAIKCDRRKLSRKCWLAEMMMQAYHNSLTPTFTTTYDALGDQETLVLKYTWDLSSYFTFFVFPFINDLTSNGEFIPAYLSRFSRMGVVNHCVHSLISGFFQWKKTNERVQTSEPLFHDFMALEPLQRAEKNFYRIGLTVDEAKQVLDMQLESLQELARFIVAYIHSIVLGDERILRNGLFIESIDFKTQSFDPARMRANWDRCRDSRAEHCWTFDPSALGAFQMQHSHEPVMNFAQKAAS